MQKLGKQCEECDLYHDESLEEGYWHGMLLVPRASRETLLGYLHKIREEIDYHEPISIKKVRKKGKIFECCRAAVQLAVVSMIQETKGKVEKVYLGSESYNIERRRYATDYRPIIEVKSALRVKFSVFRERDAHRFLDPEGAFLDYGAKIETTMRMGLKGGLHYLFDETNPIRLCSIHLDGYQHYRRHVDKKRLIDRLRTGLREYCYIDENVKLDDGSSDHRRNDSQPYADCQFLQLTDLLVGSFRIALTNQGDPLKSEVAYPVRELVGRWKTGYGRMKNSRWFRGFCISQCFLENGNWRFEVLPSKVSEEQLSLGFEPDSG